MQASGPQQQTHAANDDVLIEEVSIDGVCGVY